MRITNYIYITLFLFLLSSCDRISRNQSQSAESEEQVVKRSQPETPAQSIEDSLGVEQENTNKEVTSKEGEKASTEELNDSGNKENVDIQLSFLFLSFTWGTWTLIFSILTIILLILLILLFRKNATLNNEVDKKNKKLNQKNDKIGQLKWNIKKLESVVNGYKHEQNSEGNRKNDRSKKQISRKDEDYRDSYDDEKPVEVPLFVTNSSANTPDTPPKQPVNLYAEKATEASIFSNVSDQKNEHRSIFKLSLEDQQADTAQFEVLNSDYILKMAVNSPDTYLYTVCKPENSNQNFSEEITTLKKGIAHKIDGKWQVKDENKATIKFQ